MVSSCGFISFLVLPEIVKDSSKVHPCGFQAKDDFF